MSKYNFIVKISESLDSEGESDYLIQSEDVEFRNEVLKFVCPVRLAKFLDENEDKYFEVKELDMDSDLISIDLVGKNKEIVDFQIENGIVDYIENSSNLDKYGREL